MKKKIGLVRRGLASKISGKFYLTGAGKTLLNRLRREEASKMPDVVRAKKPTRKKTTLLFVCADGVGSSADAQRSFVDIASKNPLQVNILLDHIGYRNTPDLFKHLALKSDFIIPIGTSTTLMVKQIISTWTKKPHIIDLEFHILSDMGCEIKYFKILEIIKEHLKQKEKL